jgi:UDP-glucose 4-epimerase
LEYVALRTANPYGELQDPDRPQGLVAVAMGRILRRQPIVIYGQGEVQRDFVYVGDVAQAFVAAVHAPIVAQVYNVGSSSGLSLNDMLAQIFAVTSRTTEVQYTAPRLADAPANVLDIELIRQQLNWRPIIDLDTGLERTWQWIKNQFE